jgi:hypothetical protein
MSIDGLLHDPEEVEMFLQGLVTHLQSLMSEPEQRLVAC